MILLQKYKHSFIPTSWRRRVLTRFFDEPITPERFSHFPHISVSRRGRQNGSIDSALDLQRLFQHVALVTARFSAALMALLHTNMIMPLPTHLAQHTPLQALGLRTFTIPLSQPSITLKQAWHPRHDNNPAHRRLRYTIKRLCEAA